MSRNTLDIIATVGSSNTVSPENIASQNAQNFSELISQIEAHGAGAYDMYYNYTNNGVSKSTCFTFMVGPDAFNPVTGKFDPTMINFHNPGSSVSGDLWRMDAAFSDMLNQQAQPTGFRTIGNVNNEKHGNVDIHVAYQNGKYDEGAYHGEFGKATANLVSDVVNVTGTDKSNVSFSGFSACDIDAFRGAIKYAGDNNAQNTVILSIEPAQDEYYKRIDLTEAEKQIIKDQNITIIDIHNSSHMNINNHAYNDQYNDDLHYYEVKVNAYYDEGHSSKAEAHGWAHQLFSSVGLGDIAAGNFDWTKLPSSYETSDGLMYFDYEVIEHIPNEDGTVTTQSVSLEKMNEIMASRENTIQSSTNYIDKMRIGIETAITASSLVEPKIIVFTDSTTQYPLKSRTIYNDFFKGISNLNEKIKIELDAIVEAGDRYKELDNKLEGFKEDPVIPTIPELVLPEIEYLYDYEANPDGYDAAIDEIAKMLPAQFRSDFLDRLSGLDDLERQYEDMRNGHYENVTTEAIFLYTYDQLRANGLSEIGAKAVLANMCGTNPTLDPLKYQDNGTGRITGPAFGLSQLEWADLEYQENGHTYHQYGGGEADIAKAWCDENGYDYFTIEGQVAYLAQEGIKTKCGEEIYELFKTASSDQDYYRTTEPGDDYYKLVNNYGTYIQGTQGDQYKNVNRADNGEMKYELWPLIEARDAAVENNMINLKSPGTQTAMPTASPKPAETPKPSETPAPSASPRPTETPKPSETPAPSASPRPTETPKPSETPTPSASPRPTETPKPSETPAPSASPKPTETPRPSETPAPTASPKPAETPKPSETPAPSASPRPTETPKPSETPAPSASPRPTETPKPSETPTPSASPRPTETPKPSETPAPSASPKPTETPKPSETPMPSASPRPTETPKPSETPAPSASPKPTETPKPSETPTPSASPKPTETPKPSETPMPSASPRPTETPKPSETPTPSASPRPTETPKPSETPTPSASPRPTETPKPSETPAPSASPRPTETPKPSETPTNSREEAIDRALGLTPTAINSEDRRIIAANETNKPETKTPTAINSEDKRIIATNEANKSETKTPTQINREDNRIIAANEANKPVTETPTNPTSSTPKPDTTTPNEDAGTGTKPPSSGGNGGGGYIPPSYTPPKSEPTPSVEPEPTPEPGPTVINNPTIINEQPKNDRPVYYGGGYTSTPKQEEVIIESQENVSRIPDTEIIDNTIPNEVVTPEPTPNVEAVRRENNLGKTILTAAGVTAAVAGAAGAAVYGINKAKENNEINEEEEEDEEI